MKKLVVTLFALAAAQAASAQTVQEKYKGHAYAFWSLAQPFDDPGTGMAFGGGVEGFVYRGLSAGFEGAYLFPTERPSLGIGMLSLNPAYHFLNTSRSRKLVPFVTGGYSFAYRSGAGHFFNYGGGVTYWFSEKVGLRLELRDHRYIPYPRDSLVMFRVGVSFR